MSRFTAKPTLLNGVTVIDRTPITDSRGYFERMYCSSEFRDLGIIRPLVQINHSFSRQRGTVRGMHFQLPPHAEMKIVSCLRGIVWDVAVDLRRESPTYLRWHAEILSEESHRTLVIPEGCAHGFQALSDDTELVYFTTAAYDPSSERGVNPRDPLIDIRWPLPISEISDRDRTRPMLDDSFRGIDIR